MSTGDSTIKKSRGWSEFKSSETGVWPSTAVESTGLIINSTIQWPKPSQTLGIAFERRGRRWEKKHEKNIWIYIYICIYIPLKSKDDKNNSRSMKDYSLWHPLVVTVNHAPPRANDHIHGSICSCQKNMLVTPTYITHTILLFSHQSRAPPGLLNQPWLQNLANCSKQKQRHRTMCAFLCITLAILATAVCHWI